MHQVIANLCTNAVHAMDEGSGGIEIKLDGIEIGAADATRLGGLRPGNFARLSVADTGSGMSPAVLQRLFEPFFTTKPPGKGTGLGLAVVHGIVQAHDGAIAVTSQPGSGSTFELYFPGAERNTTAPVATAVAPPKGRGERVLFLDDEEALVELGVRMLERHGYRVSGFIRAEEAIARFRDDPSQFDIVVSDLSMAAASGLEVAAEMLAIRPGVPVVLCSGYVTEDLRERARSIGIRAVLYKPNTMAEFGEAIARLLDSFRDR
jgi:CheY-like chemotaxis protein